MGVGGGGGSCLDVPCTCVISEASLPSSCGKGLDISCAHDVASSGKVAMQVYAA